MSKRTLILASSSRYRAELLSRLQITFGSEASAVDETPQTGESAAQLSARLADAKARHIARLHPQAWVLGSDQSAAIDGLILGKPGSVEQAQCQLERCSGRQVSFHTAIALLRGTQTLRAADVTTVHFRTLSADEIRRYIAAEPALDCAGSFKCEGYGITLFDAIESRDPTALIGLPLIATARLLREAGWSLP